MRIDISFLAAFLLIGTDLLGRAAVQGVVLAGQQSVQISQEVTR